MKITNLTMSSFFRHEISYRELPRYQEMMDPPFDVHDGYFHVSDRPGLGHEIRKDALAGAIPF